MGKRSNNKNRQQIPLNEFGLSLLGTALYLGALDHIRNSRLSISLFKELQAQGLSSLEIEHEMDVRGLNPYIDFSYKPKIDAQMRWARNQIRALGKKRFTLKEAKRVTIHDFEFQWFHLYENPELALYLKDLGTSIGVQCYFSDYPISEHDSSELSGLLWNLLFNELAILVEGRFSLHRPPREGSETRYSLLVSDLCGGGITYGRPNGSGFIDDTDYGVEIACEAMKEQNLNPHAAARFAVDKIGVATPLKDGKYTTGIAAFGGDRALAIDRLYKLVKHYIV